MKKTSKFLVASVPFIVIGAAIGTYILVSSDSKNGIIKEEHRHPPLEINQKKVPEGPPSLEQGENDGDGRIHDGNYSSTPLQIIYDQYDIFPELRQQDFYEYIRIVDGKAIIDDRMIAEIVKSVIRSMNISDGDIQWGYNRISNSNVIFTFKWITSQRTYSHSYEFRISDKSV